LNLYINKKSQIMHRFWKLLLIMFILWFVFFIICDEKWYKIELNENHIVLVETEKKSEAITENHVDNITKLEPTLVYKNSDFIRIYPGFKDSNILRSSDWMDPGYLAKLEEERIQQEEAKRLEEERKKIELALQDENSISKVFRWEDIVQSTGTSEWDTNNDEKQEDIEDYFESIDSIDDIEPITLYPAEKVEHNKITLNLSKWIEIRYPAEKVEHSKIALNLSKWIEIPRIKVDKYPLKDRLVLNLYDGKVKILYKNSDSIKINPLFELPRNMRVSSGIDEKFLVKQKNETIISLNDKDSISSAWKADWENSGDLQNDLEQNDFDWDLNLEWNTENDTEDQENQEEKSDLEYLENELWSEDWDEFEYLENLEVWNDIDDDLDEDETGQSGYFIDSATWASQKLNITRIIKPKFENHSLRISRWVAPKVNLITIDKPKLKTNSLNISKWVLPELNLVKVDKYKIDRHTLNMKKWVLKEYDFVVENIDDSSQDGISDEMLETLLWNEEIDIDTLESENDEFLQQVFEKTRDTYIMNLIVENYLNEYQFVKAKKFIENLPELYYKDLKPSLNLRVAFNSFALTSKTTNETLTSLIQSYKSKNQISDEDWNWYLWILALMQRDYDKFFTIAGSLTSDSRKAFAAKILWYKDQISKQMWMPEYYFDTLVALELFNQWLFQPAKVLALYSLQKNPDYILPHQILAYANFLTNSWDTSVEYLKKLADLDQNNAEKYRFLMGVAYYWAEKYEQSVTMLSTIQSDNLRLDAQRYLINDYLQLDQKNKLIASRNKLLWYENLVASDFYTYFYEVFYHPYSEGGQYQLYAFDTELANKMLRVCSMKLSDDERAVCTYGSIGRNIALWKFDWLEQYLLDLTSQYPQWYLYQALWEYYIQQWDTEKAKVYLLKAVSLINSKNKSEISQVKKLLETIM